MLFNSFKVFITLSVLSFFQQCHDVNESIPSNPIKTSKAIDTSATEAIKSVTVGAARLEIYLPQIKDKRLALMVNQTSVINDRHLVDTLVSLGLSIQKIFAPEHGFRGKADAGEKVKDGVDLKTGIPIHSLYGKHKKPSAAQLKDIDLVIFDIQDVGARFYTYISSMTYVMEACAENNVPFLVLDRPNPNGHYVDGPVLKKARTSFVGLHSVPIVHGMTVAEYAKMVNEAGWLKDGIQCALSYVLCENYDHQTRYELPIKPSPNLPNIRSIYLYPSLCLFEGTEISVGRGTHKQFQIFGAPELQMGDYTFIPKTMEGAKYPKHEGKTCRGFDLSQIDIEDLKNSHQINIGYLLQAYQHYPDQEQFFLPNDFFHNLAGNDQLMQQIIAGKSEADIRDSWQPDLSRFMALRKQYLLY